MNLNEVFLLLKVFGPFWGIFFILTLGALSLILYFFKNRIESIAQEISNKAITEFNKKLDLAFRDESLRINLQNYLGKKSLDKKLFLYDEVYSLYFEYQKSWNFDNETPKEEIYSLWSKILQLRQKIFLNSIYLGGYLTDNLLKSVISMHSLLEDKISKINNPLKSHYPSYVHPNKSLFSEIKLSEYLDNAREWLNKNLMTDQSIKIYDFTDDQKKFLENEKEKIFRK